MAEYIERNEGMDIGTSEDWYINSIDTTVPPIWTIEHLEELLEDFIVIPKETPSADVRPERHGHIVWKERHSGGFRERKCLSDCGNSVFTPSCNQVARIDDRCTENRPYCSECGKLLGEFLNYCGNCGAKMDGKDRQSNE